MRCNLSMVLFWVFLFVLVFSGVSNAFSEQADITKTELATLLNEREYLKIELKDFKEKYNQLDQKYLDLEHKYQTLELESHRLKIESDLRTDSLMILKKETNFNFWKGFLSGSVAGFGLGFGTGNFTGIKIGVTL